MDRCAEASRILFHRHGHCQRPKEARKRPHPVPASPGLYGDDKWGKRRSAGHSPSPTLYPPDGSPDNRGVARIQERVTRRPLRYWYVKSMIGAGTEYGLRGVPDARAPLPGRSDVVQGTLRCRPAQMFVYVFPWMRLARQRLPFHRY
jgi:hypothetical protein